MTLLNNYRQFGGTHWETGTVRNYFDYRGVTAPHTDRPFSEALLLGVSGGVVMAYFSFAYEGYDPQARVLTRNTFDPWDTMLSRLGLAQNIHQTAKPDAAVTNLLATLDEGTPAIVWADMWSLPYNALEWDKGMWGVFPILVFGYDESHDVVSIADRSRVPLTCSTDELATARSRVRKVKHRLLTLEAPDSRKLAAAVTAGIWDCIRLYTENPPKGSKNNFGLAAFRYWAELLTKPKARLSWARVFAPGTAMLSGLRWAYEDIMTFGKDGHAERDMYAAFLDEAAVILRRPALRESASHFRVAASAWDELAAIFLSDDIEPLGEVRRLIDERHQAFLSQGNTALERMHAIDARLAEIRADIAAQGFPLDDGGVTLFRQRLAEQVMLLHDQEAKAVKVLKEAMA